MVEPDEIAKAWQRLGRQAFVAFVLVESMYAAIIVSVIVGAVR